MFEDLPVHLITCFLLVQQNTKADVAEKINYMKCMMNFGNASL